jgi:dihydrofolate reductase
MKRIVYYVASSLDGFIAGPKGNVSSFIQSGEGVEKYLSDLAEFKTVIMGRKTYEVGYDFGLEPGQPAYPHMQHHIFSNSLNFSSKSGQLSIEKLSFESINKIRLHSETDIYLCGGGQFAGWLLDNDLIDVLKIKLNPVVLGDGVGLFGASSRPALWTLRERLSFSDGLQILTYDKKRDGYL